MPTFADAAVDLPSFRVIPPNKNIRAEDLELSDGTKLVGPNGLLIPQARSFTSIINSATRVYSYRFDEAMRDNQIAARSMRRDAFIRGLLEERILPTINREFRVDIDDDRDPEQIYVRDGMTKILENVRDFDAFKRAALDAVWFGRAGCQWAYARDPDIENMWGVSKWDAVHGDSVQFTFDGTPAILMDSLTTSWYTNHGATVGPNGDIRPTDRGGMALVLHRPYWRDRFAVHRHILEKADFFEGELAGSVQGLGLRGLVYWHYVLRSDALTWMLAYMQAVGMMDLLVFNYPAGNAEAKLVQEANAKKIIGKAAISCPRNPNGTWPAVEQIPMNEAGLRALHDLVADYFDRHIERLIVGQNMSSGTDKGDGLGGTGRADFARATKDEILAYDTNRLDATLTQDLVRPLKRYNFSWAKFPVRFKSVMPDLDRSERMQSGATLVQMGVPVKVDELREAGGYSRPEEGDETVGGMPPMMPPGAGMDPNAPPGTPPGAPPGGPPLPPGVSPPMMLPPGSPPGAVPGGPMPFDGSQNPPGPRQFDFGTKYAPGLGPTARNPSPGRVATQTGGPGRYADAPIGYGPRRRTDGVHAFRAAIEQSHENAKEPAKQWSPNWTRWGPAAARRFAADPVHDGLADWLAERGHRGLEMVVRGRQSPGDIVRGMRKAGEGYYHQNGGPVRVEHTLSDGTKIAVLPTAAGLHSWDETEPWMYHVGWDGPARRWYNAYMTPDQFREFVSGFPEPDATGLRITYGNHPLTHRGVVYDEPEPPPRRELPPVEPDPTGYMGCAGGSNTFIPSFGGRPKRRGRDDTVGFTRYTSGPHQYGCVMAPLTGFAAIKILELGQSVPDEHLADDGREDDPHVTCLYGLHAGVTGPDVARAVGPDHPLRFKLGKVGVFRGAESGKPHDVLVAEIERAGDLRDLHARLKTLPHTLTYNDYKPHATICYVKPGWGDHYAAAFGRLDVPVVATNVVYSPPAGEKQYLDLTGGARDARQSNRRQRAGGVA